MAGVRSQAMRGREGRNERAPHSLTSYYEKNEVSSDTEYECHAGALIAGVALKGMAVELAE